MSLTRLLFPTLLLLSTSVAQNARTSAAPATVGPLSSGIVITPPKHTDPARALIDGIATFKVDAYRVIPSIGIVPTSSMNPVASPLPREQSLDDTTCYAIRSYVFARDDKDSDSTHLVRYSTCQPANRYRLRTAAGSAETEPSR